MATYFVASGGSNTSPYDTWAKAATSLATALAASTASGDVVVVQYNAVPSTDAELAADTIYTLAGDITILSASNDGGSAYTYTAMGTANWIGNSTTNRYIRWSGADRRCIIKGLTLRTAGSTADGLQFGNTTAGLSLTLNSCYLWCGNTAANFAGMEVGVGGGGVYTFVDCTLRFGATTQYIQRNANCKFIRCTVTSAGSIPATIFAGAANASGLTELIGCDFSQIAGTLIGNMQSNQKWILDRCIFGAGMTVLATQTSNPNLDSGEAFLNDCLIGTTRVWGHYNALGSTVRETGIYYTGSSAGNESWKIVGSSNCSYRLPYESPWIDFYNTGTSAITPRFEILRDGSTTAYTDAEVWAQFSWKNTSSSPLASGLLDDWQGLAAATAGTAGANQAAGAGTGSWTGEAGSAWSGKIDSGSAITPTEAGYLRGRVCVAGSITVYVDPVIRTA